MFSNNDNLESITEKFQLLETKYKQVLFENNIMSETLARLGYIKCESCKDYVYRNDCLVCNCCGTSFCNFCLKDGTINFMNENDDACINCLN